jgi:hypothetical protein
MPLLPLRIAFAGRASYLLHLHHVPWHMDMTHILTLVCRSPREPAQRAGLPLAAGRSYWAARQCGVS